MPLVGWQLGEVAVRELFLGVISVGTAQTVRQEEVVTALLLVNGSFVLEMTDSCHLYMIDSVVVDVEGATEAA